eukprot:CAMPEP_0172426654 /NCGR_PEP_ID=MMETSP1064-20121228/38526_1 /TAXON_ID=202472 /ORGANISM="Aulacoseira subarctica , Strain CCAP 1002/5" /LENGTH=127 /DNA_ID=CAMNT_0013170385 /DNA_START=236 /DNA_END=619 /DNA_ORIENTATION=+
MIELNGEILPPLNGYLNNSTNSTNETSSTVELGLIRFENNMPIMIVGSHELRGKVEKLAMPFVVMRKILSTSDEFQNISSKDDNNNKDTSKINDPHVISNNVRTSYEVAAIIRRKFIFTEYPNAIIR